LAARSPEGYGTFDEMLNFNGMSAVETSEFLNPRIDKLGGPDCYNHYAVGWAQAMDMALPVDHASCLALGRNA
jgi:hypothetical protein